MAYPLDETASTALSDSGNADLVDPAYYCSNQSVEISIQGYKLNE